MKKENNGLLVPFNFVACGKELQDFSITLVRGDAESFRLTLARWLQMHHEDTGGNAKEPGVAGGKVTIRCTGEMLGRIERQFASDILCTDPPPRGARGAIFPPKVDPFDVSKW
jgi:hypothetical protein